MTLAATSQTRSPSLRRTLWLTLGAWTLVSVLVALQASLRSRTEDDGTEWGPLLLFQFAYWYGWALLTPVVLWLIRALAAARIAWAAAAAVHVAAGLAACVLMLAWFTFLMRAIVLTGDASFASVFGTYFGRGFHYDVVTYAAVLGLGFAARFRALWREGERQALALERQLVESQLEALRFQLQPHFFFNTLNTVSALVESDPSGARAVLARLGRLLRSTLDLGGRRSIALRDELELLDDYVKIQESRFEGLLRFEVEVEPDCRDAAVPPLLIQPLVENALEHGVEPSTGAGHVEVSCRREGESLRIDVSDRGPGLPSSQGAGGIGLANVRSRLAHLFADTARLSLVPRSGGGATATIRLPFQTAD